MNTCKNCGQSIGADKRVDSHFCSGTCKTRYHEKRRANGFSVKPKAERFIKYKPKPQNGDSSLSGMLQSIPLTDPADDIQSTGSETERPALEAPRNIIHNDNSGDNLSKTKKKPQQNRQLMELIPLPQRFHLVNEKIENPRIIFLIQFDKDLVNTLNRINAEVKQIDKEIINEAGRDGKVIIGGGLLTGGVMGYNIFKNKSADWTLGEILGATGVTVLGGIAGNAINEFLKPIRDKEIKGNIIRLMQKRQQKVDAWHFLNDKRQKVTAELLSLPRFIESVASVENPDYHKIVEANRLAAINNEAILNETQDLSGTETEAQLDIRETENIRSAENMLAEPEVVFDTQGQWFDFLGQPDLDFFCAIHGLSGAGKSHFAIQLAKYLAENHGYVLYISSEEGFSVTLKKKVRELVAAKKGFYFSDLQSGQQILTKVPDLYHFIIIDSLNNMKIDPELMKAIRAKFNRTAFIAICQSTKNDDIRGSYEIVHDADTVIKVSEGIALTTKNRFTDGPREFDVFAALNKKDKPEPKIIPYNRKKKKDDNDNGNDEISSTI